MKAEKGTAKDKWKEERKREDKEHIAINRGV
jgi:hypothetical protein